LEGTWRKETGRAEQSSATEAAVWFLLPGELYTPSRAEPGRAERSVTPPLLPAVNLGLHEARAARLTRLL